MPTKLRLDDGTYLDADDIATEDEVGSGGGTYEVATNSPADGVDDAFTFTSTPIVVFRNGVMETRLGTITTNTFTFDAAPNADDDIEALV